MSNTSRLIALILAPMLLVGCGKHATTGVSSGEVERMIDSTPHLAAATTVASKQAVGVEVDGRWYAKGTEPAPATYVAPAAPAAGKGHAHLTVSLKGVTGFVGGIRITLKAVGAKTDATPTAGYIFSTDELVGTSVQTTLTDVAPGDYTLVEDVLDNVGGVFSQNVTTVVVVAGKTAEASL